MIDCPVRTAKGCRGFAEYIYAALIKNGIANQYDVEAALSYVIQKMLMDTSELGQPRANLFTGFTERPHTAGFNPLQARFMAFLTAAIRNIAKNKVPRLLDVQPRPPGTMSIGQGGDEDYGISGDAIPARRSWETAFGELADDVSSLLRRKEREEGLPLVKMFQAMIAGEKTEQQRQIYGERDARRGRDVILGTIEQYAQSTGNELLLRQVRMMRNRNPNEPLPPRRTLAKSRTPRMKPGREKDFASILSVIDRLGRPVGSSDLMRFRRRWVEYPSRTPGYKNRLEEILDLATKDGVLTATKTRAGATVYSPGPKADQFRNVEQPV